MKYDPDIVSLDIEGMTLAEEGAYSRCVRNLWKIGPLPEERLQRLCGDQFAAVKTCLREYPEGWSLPWLEGARNDAVKGRKQRSEAGKKSAEVQADNQRPSNGRLSISNSSSISEEGTRAQMIWPQWAGPNTLAKWEEFKTYRWEEHKVKYKSPKTEQAAINILASYYADGKQCVEALDFTMGKRWQFPVQPSELVGKNGHQPKQTRTDADLDAELNTLRRRPGGYGPEDLRHDKELLHRAYPHLA